MCQSTQYPVHFLKNHFLYQNVKSQSIKRCGVQGFHMLCMLVRLCTHENQMIIKGKRRSKLFRVHTLFWTKNSQTFQGLSRTDFPFLKDLIQCKKEPWVCLFWSFPNMSNFILKVFLHLLLFGTWESEGLDKVSTKIRGLFSTDCNFQGLSRTFKVCANPDCYNWLIRGLGAPNVNFQKIFVSEDDLRSRIFGTLILL